MKNTYFKASYLWCITTLLLLLLNMILLYKDSENNILLKNITEKYNEIAVRELRESEILKKNMLIQYATGSTQLPDIQLENFQTKNKIAFSSLSKETKPSLFFRFKESHCDLCVQKMFETFKEISDHFPCNHITVLCGYDNLRQFHAFAASSENANFHIYNIERLPVFIDDIDKPYLFTLSPDMKMHDVFIPIKEIPDYTIDYLDCLKMKYWKHVHIHGEHCRH